MKRFVVRPIDNFGTLGPRMRDRTWAVYDREFGVYVSDHDTRIAAREEAKSRNAERGHPR